MVFPLDPLILIGDSTLRGRKGAGSAEGEPSVCPLPGRCRKKSKPKFKISAQGAGPGWVLPRGVGGEKPPTPTRKKGNLISHTGENKMNNPKEKITIEPLKNETEYPIAYRLAQEIWDTTYKQILSPEQIKYMLDMMYAPEVIEKELKEGIRFEFVKDNGTPIGFLSYGLYHGKDTMKLHKLYLSDIYHGRGIGSMMLQYVIAAAKKAGVRKLILNVNKENARALRAYERNGFKLVEKVKNDIGNGFYMDDFVMGIDLEKYLSEGQEEFTAALETANFVYNSELSAQEIVDSACEALLSAFYGVDLGIRVTDVTITQNGAPVGEVVYQKVSWTKKWDSAPVTLGLSINEGANVKSISWEYAKWSADEQEATISPADGNMSAVITATNGIGARSAWIRVTVEDVYGNKVTSDPVKVRFYNWDWQK